MQMYGAKLEFPEELGKGCKSKNLANIFKETDELNWDFNKKPSLNDMDIFWEHTI